MDKSLEEYNNEVINDVITEATINGELTANSAFEYFCDQLIRAEVISAADRCFFEKQGLRIDGYGGNPMDDDATLNLIVVDFCDQKDKVVPINRTEIDAINKRAVNFVSKSLNSSFREELDITSEEFGLADLISKSWDQIQKIKIIFLTNKSLNVRNKEFDPIPVNGIYAEFISWDINRFYNLMLSGREKEDLVLKLSEYGGCITALNASSANNNFESYLCILSGDILANIFKKHSSQLLEQNVRVFLQAKGKVNKGIRNTIETEPNMFFSYNNGITATASHIEKEYNTKTEKGGMIITSITNFQIVNGGQTTASVHEALKRGFEKNLSDIQIQMKLSVISEQENAEKIVPKISEFANSQNKVNHIDFTSNNKFHRDMQEFSRDNFAPPKAGTINQTRWFYERTRGQYNQDKALLKTSSEKKKFELTNPKNQKVTKDQLAIVINTFLCKPDLVSKGSQKCYLEFTQAFTKKQDSQEEQKKFFDLNFFKYSMAKVLIFRRFDDLVKKAEWYEAGYKRNIVSYSIAKLIFTIKSKNKVINYGKIWNTQKVYAELEQSLMQIGELAIDHINNKTKRPDGAPANTGEYCKSSQCWELFQKVPYSLNDEFEKTLISKVQAKIITSAFTKQQRQKDSDQNEIDLLKLGTNFYFNLRKYCIKHQLISSQDIRMIQKLESGLPLDYPFQYKKINTIIQRTRSHGFNL